MNDEVQAKMILALGNAVDSLIEQAEQQQKSTQGILAKGSETINAVSLAGKEHRDLAKELPKQLKEVIVSTLDGAASKAAGILAVKFTEADEQALLAASRYERAARTLQWKIIAVVTSAWVATVAISTSMIWYTSAETQSLRQDRAMLETVMSYLKDIPQGTPIARCGPQSNLLCINVQTTKGRGEWQILAGPTESMSKQ